MAPLKKGLGGQDQQHHDRAGVHQHTGLGQQQGDHHGHHGDPPHERRCPQETQQREGGDTDQGADEVVAIGVQALQIEERLGHEHPDTGQDDRDQREDDRQHDEGRRAAGRHRGEEDQVGTLAAPPPPGPGRRPGAARPALA